MNMNINKFLTTKDTKYTKAGKRRDEFSVFLRDLRVLCGEEEVAL